jgi:6-phosphogluconolactonase (cycloisomerase 2 family)
LIAAVAACLAGALLVPANAAASTSLVQFQDGDQPRYVAFDETSGLAYVALYHSVAVVDSATRAVVGTVSPGTGAIDDLDVDRNTGAAYIASGHAVTKIDASAVVGDMPTPAALATLGFRVTRLVVAPELDRVFVAGYTSGRNGSSGHLTSLIASTGAVDQYLHLGSNAWLQDLEVDPTRGRLYGTTSAGVAVYDVTTLGHVDTVATTSRPQQLALDRSRNRLYVTQSDYDAPTAVIDTVTNTLVPALSLSGEKESMAVAVDPERGRVFVVRLWGMAPEDSLRGTVDAYTEGASERVTVPCRDTTGRPRRPSLDRAGVGRRQHRRHGDGADRPAARSRGAHPTAS